MRDLIRQLWQTCLLKSGPEQFPADRKTLMAVVGLTVVLTFASALATSRGDAAVAAGLTVLSVSLDIIVLRALVAFKSVPERFGPAMVASFGADAMLALLTSPKYLALLLPETSVLFKAMSVVELVLLGWALGVQGFIYHRTLNIGPFQGNALAFALMMLTFFLGTRLYPELLPAATAVRP